MIIFPIASFFILLTEKIQRRSLRQSEILGLMVEKRSSEQTTEDTSEEKRQLGIKQILDDDIKPIKEEYVELNDLDRRKNASSYSRAIGEIHNNITSSDGKIKCLNR